MTESLGWTLYWFGAAFLFGAVVGSFLNVVIARLPEEQSVVSPRSRCPRCETQIAWYDNIPMLSWIILRAKCRACQLPISARYPLVELLTAVLSVLTFHRFVANPAVMTVEGVVLYLVYFSFVAALVAITFIDFDHYIIPNEISYPGTALGLLLVAGLDYLDFGQLTWQSSLLGALIGSGSLLLVMGVYWLVRRVEGMGLGDVKLMAMLGAFLGAHPALLFILFVSSFLGSVVGIGMMLFQGKDMKYALPFGPFLAGSAVAYLLWGHLMVPMFLGGLRGGY